MIKRVFIILLMGSLPALAQVREFPYPAEPQYQYPVQTKHNKAMKCPKGQALFQGKCRIVRPVY